MEDNLKRFVQQHRDDFDSHEPPAGLWNRIENNLQPPAAVKRPPVYRLLLKAVAAALVVFLAGTGAWYLLKKDKDPATAPGMAVNNNKAGKEAGPDTNGIASLAPGYAGQVYQFATMIETKQRELKTLTEDDTALSNQFERNFYQLDSAYNALKQQLPASPGREALLQALIYNLELQLEVLNHQLSLIRDIHHKKNTQNANIINEES